MTGRVPGASHDAGAWPWQGSLMNIVVSALLVGLLPTVLCQEPSTANASTVVELRTALLANATTVAVLANLNFTTENWPTPVLVTRAVTIYSPYRVKLNFCGKGASARSILNVTSSGSLLLQRLFLRNFLPSAPQDLSGFGPVPALLSSGGLITFKLVVFHFLPSVTWVFDPALAPGSFWAAERLSVMADVYRGTSLQLQQPALYLLRYQSPPAASAWYKIDNCFAPMDLRSCYADDRDDTTLVYCLYTLADSLRNPAVRYVRVFHDIGLDRSAFARNRPILLTQPKTYRACPGFTPSLNMDKILYGVAVRASLEFSGMRFKGSVPTNFTAWPPALPLLLSMLDVDGPGSVSLSNAVVEVSDLAATVAALRALPGCCTADVSRPDLQPTVDAWPSAVELAQAQALAAGAGGVGGAGANATGGIGGVQDAWQPPAPPAALAATAAQSPSFTISQWVLSKNAWQLYSAANTYASLLSPSSATWRFTDVMVTQSDEAVERELCFGAPLEQGAATRGQVAVVASDLQLRLAMMTARYIQVVSDIKFDPGNWPTGDGVLVPGGGMVEVRACHPVPGRRYTLDLSELQAVIRSTGRIIFQGDLRFLGVGWTSLPPSALLSLATGQIDMSPVGAFVVGFNSQGVSGSVEFEGVVIEGVFSRAGVRQRDLLNVLHLSHMTATIRALNVSLRGESGVTLGVWTVVEDATQMGSWGFTHTDILWTDEAAALPPPPGTAAAATDGASSVALKILVPSVVAGSVLLLATAVLAVAYLCCRRRRRSNCTLQNQTVSVLQKLGYNSNTSLAASAAAAEALGDRQKSLSSSLVNVIIQAPSGAAASNGGGGANGDASAAATLAAVLHVATKILNGSTRGSNASASVTKADASEAALAAAALAVLEQARSGRKGLGGVAPQDAAAATVTATATEGPGKEVMDCALLGGRERSPMGDIDAAKRAMSTGPATTSPGLGSAIDELVLQNVLGEGSYGRVYRALWRGTTVAVKVILLPARISGRERHERMAVMEAAISSSLSHPNIVQTFMYGVEAVEGAKARANGMQGSRTQNSCLPEASTAPLASGPPQPPSPHLNGTGGPMGASGTKDSKEDLVGWEIRLVQEFCDLGSLRDKLNERVFFRPASAAVGTITTAMPLLPPPRGGRVAASVADAGDPEAATAATKAAAALPSMPYSTPPCGSSGAAASGGGDGVGGGNTASGASSRAAGGGALASGVGSDGGSAMVVDLAAVLDTAIDVARAMVHLHRRGIVHADLKPRNVLLRGSTTDPRGFVAKVADFGLSVRLDGEESHASNAYHGTLAYMAPETMLNGHVSRASDVYGFGILLYELYTSDTAFRGVPKALLGHAITKDNLRPVFPPSLGAPFEYQLLACRCWESNPEIRPDFDFVLEDLKRMRLRLCSQLPDVSSVSTACGRSLRGLGEACGEGRWGLPQLPAFASQAARMPFSHTTNVLCGNLTDGDRSLSMSHSVSLSASAYAYAAGGGLAHTASAAGLAGVARQLISGSLGGLNLNRVEAVLVSEPVALPAAEEVDEEAPGVQSL